MHQSIPIGRRRTRHFVERWWGTQHSTVKDLHQHHHHHHQQQQHAMTTPVV
jgi:hypothetical protein